MTMADAAATRLDPTQPVVVGLCQNFSTLGARLNAPSSALIAVQGSLTQ